MGNYEKFIKKLLHTPTRTDITFEEAYKFLTNQKVGFSVRHNGSHYTFYQKGINPITIPKDILKHYAIKNIIKALQDLGLID